MTSVLVFSCLSGLTKLAHNYHQTILVAGFGCVWKWVHKQKWSVQEDFLGGLDLMSCTSLFKRACWTLEKCAKPAPEIPLSIHSLPVVFPSSSKLFHPHALFPFATEKRHGCSFQHLPPCCVVYCSLPLRTMYQTRAPHLYSVQIKQIDPENLQ